MLLQVLLFIKNNINPDLFESSTLKYILSMVCGSFIITSTAFMHHKKTRQRTSSFRGAPSVNLLEHLDYILSYLSECDNYSLLEIGPPSQRELAIVRKQGKYVL